MRRHLVALILAGTAATAAPAAADVRVTLQDGRVSLSARDATVRQILTEWARVGQVRIVNIERVTGAPVTIELTDAPEAQALDVVLRSTSGYVAAPRAVAVPNASRYDRILLLPASTPAAPGRPGVGGAAPPGPSPAPFQPAAPPVFQPPAFQPQVQQIDDQDPDDQPAGNRPGGAPNGLPVRPPNSVNPMQQAPQPDAPSAPAQPVAYPAPTSPFGTAVPGMPVPVPQQAQPPAPGQPRR